MRKADIIRRKQLYIRGKIISDCVEIEDWLTFRLTEYFFKKSCREKTEFHWLIINSGKYSFSDKVDLFKSIPYFQKRTYFPKITKSLDVVRPLRNKIAHWELVEGKSKIDKKGEYKIFLQDPLVKKDDLVITKKTVKAVNEHKKRLINFFENPRRRIQ